MLGVLRGIIICAGLGVALAGCTTTPEVPAFKTDRDRAELHGQVKTVSVEFEGRIDKYGQIDRHHMGSTTYDAAGNFTDDEDVTPDFVKKRHAERLDPHTVHFHSIMGDTVERDTYDAQGNTLEEATYFGDKVKAMPDQIMRSKFDAQGREIERDFIGPDGKIGGAFLYTRDAAGNVVTEEDWLNDIASPHAKMTYTYIFDTHGNWIQRNEVRTGVADGDYPFGPTGTQHRVITYYGDAGGDAKPAS